jgi:hypothetical protein
MKLSKGDSKKSIFREVNNIFNIDFNKSDRAAIATRVEKMTHFIKDRKFTSYKEKLKFNKQEFFYDVVDLDNINIDNINNILKRWSVNKDLNEYHSTVKFLENEIKEKSEALKKLKKNELERICKEYFKNDYERRFKVTIQTMISALVGEENVLQEITNFKRLQRVSI